MKTLNKIIGLLTITLLVVSCSSVKVTDSWRQETSKDIMGEQIMVVSVTDNEISRQRFEKDLTTTLNSNGFESFESYAKYPEMNPTKKVSQEDITKLKQKLQSNGVNLVVISAVKEIKEYTETNTTGSSYGMPMYGYRGYRGFHGYYGGMYMDMGTSTSTTKVKKKYKLETVIYDLSKPKDKELIAVVSTEIDDPQKLTKISKDFSDKITKELMELFPVK
ncbi:MAG: hypothetical protein BM563_09325 [Bacteroidetes bacterium MedPE-SWsnd-G1]|mgnify:CR=1 FL=1|nr:MAG: hypothetical protein BM563_09325 [Bacteroidetes bacterium MedPE-SWsnd-G1]